MTTRDLTAAMASAVQAGNVRPAILYEGEFVDGSELPTFVRLWSGLGTLSWNGNDWLGAGNLIGFSEIKESTGLQANPFEAWLSGMTSEVVALALTSARKNRSGKIWLALFDAAEPPALIANPYLLKRGRFDTIPIENTGAGSRITARYEDRLVALGLARERRYTTADQALRAPGDLGFEYVEALQDAQFLLPS